ncbi:MAG TPA: SUF system NifU family Fe-S cluster assembly protein [bacterium]|nr:SUF system NifU family Fe-S cluster assembly protein [bacterium]
MALDELYQEVLLDHYKQPRNKGVLAEPDIRLELKNPFCGDEILLTLKMAEGRVAEAAFEGHGCVISQASASVMTEKIKGLRVEEVAAIADQFTHLVREGKYERPEGEEFDEIEAFAGVCEFPTRVKCAMLAWRTLLQGLKEHEGREHLHDHHVHGAEGEAPNRG